MDRPRAGGGSQLDSEIFNHLQKVDWGKVGKRLLAFTRWWADKYRWHTGEPHILPRGYTLEDIVQQVILKTISGQRRWDPARGELEPWLKDQVKSEIDALAKSASHRREAPFVVGREDEEGAEEDLRDRAEYRAIACGALGDAESVNPEVAVLDEVEIRQKVDALFEAVGGEPKLEEVLQAILDGCEPKPRYLAEALGVSVKDINNRMRRLLRRATTLDKDLSK